MRTLSVSEMRAVYPVALHGDGRKWERVECDDVAVAMRDDEAISGKIKDTSPEGVFFACDVSKIRVGDYLRIHREKSSVGLIVKWAGHSQAHDCSGIGGQYAF